MKWRKSGLVHGGAFRSRIFNRAIHCSGLAKRSCPFLIRGKSVADHTTDLNILNLLPSPLLNSVSNLLNKLVRSKLYHRRMAENTLSQFLRPSLSSKSLFCLIFFQKLNVLLKECLKTCVPHSV